LSSHLALVHDQTALGARIRRPVDRAVATANDEAAQNQALMRQCQSGDQAAFRDLVQRNMAQVYNLLLQMTSDVTLSEDLTQETFIKVWRFAHRYNPSRPFRPWLLQIAVNTLRSSKRKSQLNVQSLDALVSDGQWHEPGSDVGQSPQMANPETIASHQESWQQALQALAQLPDNQRQAMVLRYQFDLPYEDIATNLNVPINTVRTWLKRGRDKLTSLLKPQPDVNPPNKDQTSS
jgi:RNA polymerase sigma-70 factor (ECF subfamily)